MSVSKMKDGKRWKVTCRFKTWDGTIKQHKKEGFQTRKEAQEYERNFLAEKSGSANMSFESMCKLFLEDCKPHIKPTTLYNYNSKINSIFIPYFGKKAVDEITPNDIRQWLIYMQKPENGYKASSIKTHKITLNTIFEFAIKYYGLKENPCKRVRDLKVQKPKMDFLTHEEFKLVIAQEKSQNLVVAFNILFWTGMRLGELLALTPQDIHDGTISISKTFHSLNGEKLIVPPKTPSSNRTVTIPDFLTRMISDYMGSLKRLKNTDIIFEELTPTTIRYHLKRNCKLAGVKFIRVHDLRHSHASFLIEQGFSPLLIAERLGHNSVSTTLDVYSHLYPNKQADVSNAIQKCYENDTQI